MNNINIKNHFLYENAFYLTAHKERIEKFISHYELFKLSKEVRGDIVECGVFKGASLSRFIKFRDIFKLDKKIIGFDTFASFPETNQ